MAATSPPVPNATGSELHVPPRDSTTPSSAASSTIKYPTMTSTTTRSVITVPPWARDEQPVPDEELYLSPVSAIHGSTTTRPLTASSSHERMPSDIASFTSSGGDQPHSGNWWIFAAPRRMLRPAISEHPTAEAEEGSSPARSDDLEKGSPNRRRLRLRPRTKQKRKGSWVFGYALKPINSRSKDKGTMEETPEEDDASSSSSSSSNEEDADEAEDDEPSTGQPPPQNDDAHHEDGEAAAERHDTFNEAGPSSAPLRRVRNNLARRMSSNLLRLDLPLPPAPFTKAQAETPGWDSPWNPKKYFPEPEPAHHRGRSTSFASEPTEHRNSLGTYRSRTSIDQPLGEPRKRKGGWKRRRRKLRGWCLHNLYVPLLFRIVNLAFTSATLAIAISLRRVEKHHDIMGILGSSAAVTIIFAPLTLVHVLVAIYLEYFGRPVGLWKTSAKLAHTLVDVVFVCAWSAALALCFNDFFTTQLQCGATSVDRWWSDLPPTDNQLADAIRNSPIRDKLCDLQTALISMAFVSLMSYTSNLIISLYRIIEKVKNYSQRSRVNWH